MADDTTNIPRRRWAPLSLVLLAGLLIAGACYWKRQQPAGSVAVHEVLSEGLAPRFELFDQRGQMFRLERHLGRESVVLVFCGDLTGSGAERGREFFQSMATQLAKAQAAGVVLVMITTGIPQESRRWASEFPQWDATWLSDLDGAVHRLYGRWDELNRRANTGVVQIDRRGKLPLRGRVPLSQDRLSPRF